MDALHAPFCESTAGLRTTALHREYNDAIPLRHVGSVLAILAQLVAHANQTEM